MVRFGYRNPRSTNFSIIRKSLKLTTYDRQTSVKPVAIVRSILLNNTLLSSHFLFADNRSELAN